MSAQSCLLEATSTDHTPELTQVFPFRLAPVTYSRWGIRNINDLAGQGRIFAMPDDSLGNNACYNTFTQTMYIGFSAFSADITVRREQKAVLIHECIHAMQDHGAFRRMRVGTAEAAAFIGQHLYLLACGSPRPTGDELLARAWDVARQLTDLRRRGRCASLQESQVQPLLQAIRGNRLYTRSFDTTGRYNGIPAGR